MLGWFFRGGGGGGGGGSAWVLFSAGGNLYWYTFSGGDSIPGRFFRGEVLCGGKLYATTPAHRLAGGSKKKLNPRSGSQRHRHIVGFFSVPVQAPTRDQPFYGYSEKPPHFNRLLRRAWGYGGHINNNMFYSSYDLARAYELCILVKMTIITSWTVNYHQAVIKIKIFIDIFIVIRRKSLKYMYIANFEINPPSSLTGTKGGLSPTSHKS